MPMANQAMMSRKVLMRIILRRPKRGTEYQENMQATMEDEMPMRLTMSEYLDDMPAMVRKYAALAIRDMPMHCWMLVRKMASNVRRWLVPWKHSL